MLPISDQRRVTEQVESLRRVDPLSLEKSGH